MSNAHIPMQTEIPSETTGPEAPETPAERPWPEADNTPEAPETPDAGPAEGPVAADGESDDGTKPGLSEQTAGQASRETAENTLKASGLDLAALEREYTANGRLSDASYKALADAGIGKPFVDAYIKGQEALLQATVTEMTSLAGGEERYAAMTAWAAENLPQEDIAAFNTAVSSGNKPLIKMAVSGLVSRWKAAEGSEPQLVGGRTSADGGASRRGYRSKEEMVAAMRDPRYGKDAAYTRDVERKTVNAAFFTF